MLLLSILLTAGLFSFAAFFIRWLAQRQIWWVFIPTNTFALITTQKNKDVDLTKGGGGLVGIVHNIPGQKLNTSDADPMEWFFEPGAESSGFLKTTLGVEWIGPFRYLQVNKIKSFRYTREETETEFSIKPKNLPTEYVFYSSEQAVEVKSAETSDLRELDVIYNIIFTNKYPARAVLKVADPYAVLSQLVKAKTIVTTGENTVKYFLAGNGDGKKDLVKAINDDENKAAVRRQVGIEMLEVNLLDLDPTDTTRKLLELEANTKDTNAAATAEATAKAEQLMIKVEAEAKAKERINKADEDRLNRFLRPLGESPGAIRVREAEAYEANKHVTVFAPGGNAGIMVQGAERPSTRATPDAPPSTSMSTEANAVTNTDTASNEATVQVETENPPRQQNNQGGRRNKRRNR